MGAQSTSNTQEERGNTTADKGKAPGATQEFVLAILIGFILLDVVLGAFLLNVKGIRTATLPGFREFPLDLNIRLPLPLFMATAIVAVVLYALYLAARLRARRIQLHTSRKDIMMVLLVLLVVTFYYTYGFREIAHTIRRTELLAELKTLYHWSGEYTALVNSLDYPRRVYPLMLTVLGSVLALSYIFLFPHVTRQTRGQIIRDLIYSAATGSILIAAYDILNWPAWFTWMLFVVISGLILGLSRLEDIRRLGAVLAYLGQQVRRALGQFSEIFIFAVQIVFFAVVTYLRIMLAEIRSRVKAVLAKLKDIVETIIHSARYWMQWLHDHEEELVRDLRQRYEVEIAPEYEVEETPSDVIRCFLESFSTRTDLHELLDKSICEVCNRGRPRDTLRVCFKCGKLVCHQDYDLQPIQATEELLDEHSTWYSTLLTRGIDWRQAVDRDFDVVRNQHVFQLFLCREHPVLRLIRPRQGEELRGGNIRVKTSIRNFRLTLPQFVA